METGRSSRDLRVVLLGLGVAVWDQSECILVTESRCTLTWLLKQPQPGGKKAIFFIQEWSWEPVTVM